ncbi:hypothetical protein G210_0311, partial [Candida maltosa Xu316]
MTSELDKILSIEESALNRTKEIDRILACSPHDYFSILQINPLASSSTPTNLPNLIKKLYRKKSLLIHPDKTDNPNAPDAFNRLKKSEHILNSDEEMDVNEVSHLMSIYVAYKPDTVPEEYDDVINKKIRDKVNDVLIDELNQMNLEKLYKQTEDIRKDEIKKKKQEETAMKRKLDQRWNDERDVRVENWRKYNYKVEKKQSKKGKKNPMNNQNSITIVSVGVLSFLTGYYLHQFLSPTSRSKKFKLKPTNLPTSSSEITDDTSDEEYESDSDDGIDVNSMSLNEIPGEVRMSLIVRQDLKMGKGKAAAQCSHATLALYKKITNPGSEAYNPEMVRRWEYGNGQAKITLQVPNQEEMDMLYAKAISLGINAYIVHDAGRTQIAAGSATVLGLGPAPKRILDEVTGELKLY